MALRLYRPPAIHPVDIAGAVFRALALDAAGIFEIGGQHFLDMSGNAANLRVIGEKPQRFRQEFRIEDHVAVQQADMIEARILETELWPDPAARLRRRGNLHDRDGIAGCDGGGTIAGTAIGNDDLAKTTRQGRQCAFDGRGNALFPRSRS